MQGTQHYILQPSLLTLQTTINNTLEKLGTISSLQINVNKSRPIIFTTRQEAVAPDMKFTLGDTDAEAMDSVKRLGVYFHKNMSWDTDAT